MSTENLNKPFYIPSDSPQQETAIYIGKGAGKQIHEQIRQAKKEIIIISPYISHTYIDELVTQAKNGISVKLAYCREKKKVEDLSPDDKKTLLNVINQRKHTNEEAKFQEETKIEHCVRLHKILSIVMFVGVVLIAVWLFCILQNVNLGSAHKIASFAGISMTALAWIGQHWNNEQRKKAECTPIYKYTYDTNIDIYLYKTWDLIHSKIYIIDGNIAYLGSVNFSDKSFKNNIETRICIKHTKTVTELREYTLRLMEHAAEYSHSTDELGKVLYGEPLYDPPKKS